jgi:broad specificity phosphatase PhoE
VSNLYLVRHGQAGTRDSYDSLSPLGRQQARLLGEYLASHKIKFAAAYSGQMQRQKETAEEVIAAYGANAFPELKIDCGWNEFDLDRMYREIAPQLCVADVEFRREYEAMQAQLLASRGEQYASVHRRWLPCDTTVVTAWIRGAHRYCGESWEQFCERVANCAARNVAAHQDNIAVFTSATPIAIWTGRTVEMLDRRVMKLAAVLQNASFTVVQIRNDMSRLFSFNNTPHLVSPELRTFR